MSRKTIGLSGLGLPGLLLIGVVWPNLPFNIAAAKQAAQQQFKAQWVARFRQCRTLQNVRAIPTRGRMGSLGTRTFGDGSWVAIAWHSIHDTGGEWDGSVLLDSNGKLFWSDYHFCGYEGFQAEFLNISAQSLKPFYQKAKFKLLPIDSINKPHNKSFHRTAYNFARSSQCCRQLVNSGAV